MHDSRQSVQIFYSKKAFFHFILATLMLLSIFCPFILPCSNLALIFFSPLSLNIVTTEKLGKKKTPTPQ